MARVAVPAALVGLATTGVLAFALPGDDQQTAVPAPASSPTFSTPTAVPTQREQPVSRDELRAERPTSTPSASPSPSPSLSVKNSVTVKKSATVEKKKEEAEAPALDITKTMYATDDLKIRVDPEQDAKSVTIVDPGTKLKVTATVRDGFRYVSYDGVGRWVNDDYVSSKKPDPEALDGVTMAPCPKGSSMESGLTKDAILVHRTVCARFPQVTSFGGRRGGGGFHATGQAVDCMIGSSDGWAIAKWVRANAKRLGVSEVIYSRHIWTVQRGSEGWRSMSDRGSKTANHYDHVHVSVYGNRATG